MTAVEDSRPRLRQSHIFPRGDHEHYVEESWCSKRLFDVERFKGHICDPACGWGTIVVNALQHNYVAAGYDLVQRGWDSTATPRDFMRDQNIYDNIVTNPPFDIIEDFTVKAVLCSRRKTAVLFPVARLNAAHYLKKLPLMRVWLLTPRPSMPPGSYIQQGGKVGGGRVDYCWLIFYRGYDGTPCFDWLHREKS